MSFFLEIFKFLRYRKKFWLFPLLLSFVVVAALLVLAQSSVITPFIDALF